MAIHNTLGNNATEAHGPLWQTVANTAALQALTIAAPDVSQRKLILQTDTGQLWVCTVAGTPGTFQEVARTATTLDSFAAPAANVAMNAKKFTGQAAGTAANDGATLSNRLDQFAAPNADIPMNSFSFTGLRDPAAAQEPDTKAYGDKRVQFVGSWFATTAPATTSARFAVWQNSSGAPNASEVTSLYPLPINITITSLCFSVITPLTTDTVTYTIRDNGVDTAVTGTIPANQQITTVTGLSLAVSAGHKLSLKLVQSSTQVQAAWALSVSLGYKTSDIG